MSEVIEQLIGEIRERSIAIKRDLSAERENNSKLMIENSALSAEIQKLKLELKSSQDQIGALQSEIEAIRTNNIEQPEKRTVTQEEIDELVKEIDYCITQLKR